MFTFLRNSTDVIVYYSKTLHTAFYNKSGLNNVLNEHFFVQKQKEIHVNNRIIYNMIIHINYKAVLLASRNLIGYFASI